MRKKLQHMYHFRVKYGIRFMPSQRIWIVLEKQTRLPELMCLLSWGPAL